MPKKLAKGVLILLALIIAVVVFALEPIAKFAIESEGSKAVGARVDVDSVDISLYPTHVAVHGLTVANPEQPMRNLMTSETVSADIDILTLIKKQFIVDTVVLSGMQMYTERSTPGTLDGSMPPAAPEEEGSGMPGISLPDPNAIITEEQAQIQAELDAIQNAFESIEARWQDKSKDVPSDEKIQEFKQRWEELKEKNIIERIAGGKQLRDDIKAELKQFKNLNRDIKADSAEIASLSKRAANLPASQSQRIMQKYGLDQGTEGMLKFLLGDEVNNLVQQGLTLYKQTVGDLASQEEETAPVAEGSTELPVKLLIREILIDGYQVVGEEKLAYSGKINDVTDQQDYWNKPITMALSGGIEQQSQLLIDGVFDQRNDALKSAFNLGLKQLALAGVSLSKSADLPLQLENGIADIAANFSIDGNNLNGSVKGLVNQAKLLLGEVADDNKTAQLLATAIEGVSELVMNLSVGGSVEEPIVNLKSNLDRILGDVLGAELKAQLAKHEDTIKQKLSENYGGEMDKFKDQIAILEPYKDLLGDREAALQALMKDFF